MRLFLYLLEVVKEPVDEDDRSVPQAPGQQHRLPKRLAPLVRASFIRRPRTEPFQIDAGQLLSRPQHRPLAHLHTGHHPRCHFEGTAGGG